MRKHRRNRITALLFVLLLVLLCMNTLPASAAVGTQTAYIVKYKSTEPRRGMPSELPFDVVSEEEMQRLRSAGLLEWYEPDGVMELLDEPASEHYDTDKWDLAMIRADAAFARGYLGQGVRVGVVDSGINPHPELAASLRPGSCFLDDGDPDDTSDNYGHGTLVAGLISGAGDNGYIGVAPGAELIPLKVTDGKAIMVSTVCRAIYGGIDRYGCDVLNLSLGITSHFEALKEAIDYAAERGVTVVAAAGNNGTAKLYYPAAYDTVIGVGAVDESGTVYYHSNRNASVFLTAPGANVKTTGHWGGYVNSSGTSFAVPHVTAAAAVLRGIDANADPMELLARAATDRGAEGYDEQYGYGILNVENSIRLLLGETEPCSFLPESGVAALLQNNLDAPLDVTYLLAEYDENGVCLQVSSRTLTLPAKGTAELAPPPEGVRIGQFVYETETMTPLTKERRTP